jgi:hypothetical protein
VNGDVCHAYQLAVKSLQNTETITSRQKISGRALAHSILAVMFFPLICTAVEAITDGAKEAEAVHKNSYHPTIHEFLSLSLDEESQDFILHLLSCMLRNHDRIIQQHQQTETAEAIDVMQKDGLKGIRIVCLVSWGRLADAKSEAENAGFTDVCESIHKAAPDL